MTFFGPPIRNGVPIGLGSSIGFGSAPFTPAELFYSGEQGFWYDPTDIPLAWRRNLLTRTEEFDNAAWTKVGATVSADATIAPDGTTTADKLAEDSSTGVHVTVQSATLTGGAQYAFSIYAKAAERTRLYFERSNANITAFTALYDLSTGTVVSTSGTVTATIADVGNGWYRLIAIVTAAASASAGVQVDLVSTGSTVNYTGVTGNGAFIWGAQLELGSTASNYQQIVTPEISFLTYQSQPVLYTDSTGTTPVTAVEQAVGLMLDKSKGLVLGPELVTNGDFSSGTTGWSVAGISTLAVVNGQLEVTTSSASGAQQTLTTVIGKTYFVTAALKNGTATDVRLRAVQNSYTGTVLAESVVVTSNVNTLVSIVFVATSTSTVIYTRVNSAGTNLTGYFDNISVRELPGNHAFQTSSAKRPVLRARYNQFTYSEDFGNVAWTATGTTVATNTTVSPDGAITADTLTASAGTSGKNIRQSGGGSGSSLTFSVYAKVGTHDFVQLFHGSSSNIFANFNLLTGVVGTVGASATASITSVGSGWYRCQITFTPASASALRVAMVTSQTAAFDENWNAVGTETILLWGADLRPTSQATGLIGPTYQRIAAATDYDVVGFTPRIVCDGFDDAMTTNSIDFTATDEVTVFAGVRKLSDATRGVFTEFSATTANTGVFSIDAPGLSGGVLRSYLFVSKGTATADPFQDLPNNAAPTSSVVTGIGDISGDVATLRVNGAQVATSTADQGTGNYGNYPLFIGARNQTSLYFNGEIYSLIGRGAATTAGQIAATEQWVGQRTGVQL